MRILRSALCHASWASMACAVALCGHAFSTAARAADLHLEVATPVLDYNAYPFSPTPGTRDTIQSFGAFGTDNKGVFDNRDSQVIVGFQTSGSGGIPTGLAASNYKILSVKLELVITHGNKIYDGTYDPISTYGANGESINGDDAGRPMELYGVGFRNGVTNESFTESTSAFPTNQTAGTRSVYATDFLAGGSLNGNVRDVSNNVSGLGSVNPFDPKPFAIGQVAAGDITDGKIDEDATVTFTLDLTNPDVVRYLQLSLQYGTLYLAESSLESAAQTGPTIYSRFYSKENLAGIDPKIIIDVQIIPEPSAVTLAFCGAGLFVACWRGPRGWRRPHELP